MKKNVKVRGAIAGLIVALSFSTVTSAKPAPKVEQKNSKSSKLIKHEKEKELKEKQVKEKQLKEKQLKEKEAKEKQIKEKELKEKPDRTAKELEKINRKLDKIENHINYVSERIDQYFSENLEDQDQTTKASLTIENEAIGSQQIENVTEESEEATNEEVINEEENVEIGDQESEDQELEEEEVEDQEENDEDAEETEADEEEESISGYSFIGKLNALNNRLDAVKKQMNSPSGKLDKTNEQYAATMDRIAELKKEISDNVEKLKDFQSPVLQKLKNKIGEQREYTPKNKSVETNKTWTIRFNKNLKLESLNGINIFVVDSNDTLVETKVSFDKNTGVIKIIPIENYTKGEKYTLFISKDIKSDNGEMLDQATRVPFEIK
ncbi:Ig-like domain-containing protein [Clostridium sp. ZS2-4]|uniref:Ig-like domain-containing protein n=1 Tax=Clostridium sp. ZS2-4 TaxID=2987703 RepID=UPI00227CA84A|nr:Ig-like domain-containing protein [Clostridium sp. ZS2-4]MCY6355294.1 Ig-like domain-containing protein [Clostridium sp. ZS2-4]